MIKIIIPIIGILGFIFLLLELLATRVKLRRINKDLEKARLETKATNAKIEELARTIVKDVIDVQFDILEKIKIM